MFYTYAHTKPDGTIFYIGKGHGKRAWSRDSRGRHWKHVVAKYKNYGVEILANWDTEEAAFDHEKLLISCFIDLGFKLANLTNGGEGSSGYRWTSEQKNRIVGRKSPEVAISNALRAGEKHPQFGGYIISKNIVTGEEKCFAGAKSLVDAGFLSPKVFMCINGKRKTHKGHTFKRLEV
jgi:hypothetical protein